ncbi:hypothetical protein F5Y04DRAFT_288408 [Hypomontagnella monticulosa]|nr:hypothetical protein F5Y04DRAFT_288408 [Hypomontagnella monticulosa]
MSRRGTKRKAGPEPLSDGLSHLFVRDDSAKVNKSKRSKRLSRLEEYDEDEGRESSRGFQRLGEACDNNTKGEAMKSKIFIKNFAAKVQKQMDQVRQKIEDLEKALEETNILPTPFLKELCFESATPSPYGTPNKPDSNGCGTGKDGHVLLKEADAVIAMGHQLIQNFKEMDEQLKDHKLELPTAKWKQDKQDMRELLACGREYGEKLVEDKLTPDAYPSRQSDNYKEDEKGSIASELFKDSRKPEEDNWGTVAADQLKGFVAIAKTVHPKILERTRH